MHGIFITGTSTEVGKTYIGTLLAKALTEKNISVIPRKPIESGCEIINGELLPSDAQTLKAACGYQGRLNDVCRYRFAPPVSPARAARLAGQTVTTAQLAAAWVDESENGFMLVEGAGGFYSPLTDDGLNADLAVALQLPVLLVANNELGVINQVLLNAEAINRRGLQLAAVVLNDIAPGHGRAAEMNNAADLQAMLDCGIYVYNAAISPRLPEGLIDTILAQAGR
jgi:dethiobiotin synthetase